jgi:hypothetical protein
VSVYSGGTSRPGYPFDDDYRGGPADADPTPRARQRVQRQVFELLQRRNDPALRRQLSGALQERWERRDQPRRLDVIGEGDGAETLLVGDEILVTRATWEDTGARFFLERRGLSEAALGCPDLEGRLVRLVTSDQTAISTLDDTVGELRVRGFAASLTHVTPLAPIMKCLGGPAEAPSLEPFSEYRPYRSRSAGAGVPRVAVIDTGIDGVPRDDGWLAGIDRRAADDPATHGNDANIDPLDLAPLDNYLDFSAGHGTFVSGIVAQIAPAAKISAYRALRSDGLGSEIEVACALIRAVKDGAHIVNLSLGSQTRFNQPSLAMAAALDEISLIEQKRGYEVLLIAAAGNYGDTVPTWPAAFRRVVSVGSLAADLRPTPWSSRGFWVDCSTVGEGILSTFVTGKESYEFTADPDEFGSNAFARWSGTSFSAPQVAGAVARLMHEQDLAPRQALARLLAGGKSVPDFGQAMSILPGL